MGAGHRLARIAHKGTAEVVVECSAAAGDLVGQRGVCFAITF